MTGPGWLAALNANSYNPLPPLVPGSAPVNPVSLLGPDGWPIGHAMPDWIKNGIPYRTQAERVRDQADDPGRYRASGAQSPEQGFADNLLQDAKTYGPVVSILLAALGTHVSTLMLTGFPLAKGGYEKGEGLRTGAGKFQDVSAILGSAGSDPGWQGPAAQSYDARNIEQQNRINRMAELDTQLAELVQDQEAQVKQLRKQLGMNTTQFIAAFPLAFAIWAKEPPFPLVPVAGTGCMAFQAGIALTVLGADVYLMTQQGLRSQQTGKAMQTVADGYNQIAAEAAAALPLHS